MHFAHVHAYLDVRVWFSSFVQFEMFAAGTLLALVDAHRPRWTSFAATLGVIASFCLWVIAAGGCHLKTQGATA